MVLPSPVLFPPFLPSIVVTVIFVGLFIFSSLSLFFIRATPQSPLFVLTVRSQSRSLGCIERVKCCGDAVEKLIGIPVSTYQS